MDTDTSEAIDTLRADIRDVKSSQCSDRGQLRNDVLNQWSELRLHMEKLFDSLRADLRAIAKGLVSLEDKIDDISRQ